MEKCSKVVKPGRHVLNVDEVNWGVPYEEPSYDYDYDAPKTDTTLDTESSGALKLKVFLFALFAGGATVLYLALSITMMVAIIPLTLLAASFEAIALSVMFVSDYILVLIVGFSIGHDAALSHKTRAEVKLSVAIDKARKSSKVV